ncbi:DUF441 family protein [bacterium BFN5]|nr:DUF441 family protein [bacterium BFN5]
MSSELLPLLIILILGVLANNTSVGIAATTLLLLKLLGLSNWFDAIESKGLSIGITILTIAILTPLASGRITLLNMVESFKNPIGLVAVAAGVFAAWAGGRGIPFMNNSPEIITSIIIGTIAGVCFLDGVSVGPLIAGGLVYLAMSISKLWS